MTFIAAIEFVAIVVLWMLWDSAKGSAAFYRNAATKCSEKHVQTRRECTRATDDLEQLRLAIADLAKKSQAS